MTAGIDRPVDPGQLVVSVVIPARDAERYLGETLASVLGQTRPPDEVIVIDDGSTDSTAAIAAEPGAMVRLLRQPPTGIGAARNAGVAAARGNIIALCDADDLWVPDKLERQLALIEDPDQPLAVFCGMSEFVSPELDPVQRSGRSPEPDVEQSRLSSALVATRAALTAAGPFIEGASVGEWVPWCVRLCGTVPVVYAPGPLLRRRLHDRNVSLGSGDRVARWAGALHAHVRAQRERDARGS